LGNLSNELLFLRHQLVGMEPGDFLLLHTARAWAAREAPEEIKHLDPALNGSLPEEIKALERQLLIGPIERYGRPPGEPLEDMEVQSRLEVGCCPVPGSYAVEQSVLVAGPPRRRFVVTYKKRYEPAGLWLALYDRRESLGVALARSTSPWGPFTEAGTLFTPSQWRGRILWDPERADAGLRPGPLMNRQDEARGEALTKRGGAYAPYVIERFTRAEGGRPDTIVLDWLLSTWNPYVVHLMESRVRWTTR
jgi:hypothetical protein